MLFISNFVLDLINISMKIHNNTVLFVGILLFTIILAVVFLTGTDTFHLTRLDLLLILLITGLGIGALVKAIRTQRDMNQGNPEEDELSMFIKYKSGYYAFRVSMFVWLFVFLFRDIFPDTESLVGTGILGSAVIYYGLQFYIKQKMNEKQD